MTVTITRRATLIGAGAIALWSALAVLTTFAGPVPPFQMTAMTFALGSLIGLGMMARGGTGFAPLRLPARVWLVGVGGLFGFHVLFFAALALAPPVEANLINYLWPLLIVIFAGLILGEALRWWHLVGAAMGFAGAILLIGGPSFATAHLAGYAAALGSAITWALYSVLSRRFGSVPTEAVGGFCAATAVLALGCHLALERTYWPSAGEIAAIVALGFGPVGLAFYLWDWGVKRGDIRALGAMSYLAPLFSTLLLLAFGRGTPRWTVLAACALIVGGALLAGRDLIRRDANRAAPG